MNADLPATSRFIAVPGDGTVFATATSSVISFWHLPKTSAIARCRGHESSIKAIAFSPDGKTLAAAYMDETVRLWNAERFEVEEVLEPTVGFLDAVAFSPDGRFIAAGGSEGTIALWDAASLKLRARLDGHTDEIKSIAFSPDSRRLFSTGVDRTVRVWDVDSGRCLLPDCGHVHSVNSIVFTDDDSTLVSASLDGTARAWDVRNGEEMQRVNAFPRGVDVFTVNERRMIAAERNDDRGEPTALSAWSDDGQRLLEMKGQTGTVSGIATLPGGKRFITCARFDGIRLWDVYSGRILTAALPEEPPDNAELGAGPHPAESMALSPDGKHLAVGYHDGRVAFLDPSNLAPIRDFSAHDKHSMVLALAFCPAGSVLATASSDHTARIWNVESLQPLATLQAHGHWVIDVCFSTDGALLATCGYDRTVRIWDAKTYKLRCTLEGHEGYVNCIAFSHDGKLLASGSGDTTILLWDVAAALRSEQEHMEAGR